MNITRGPITLAARGTCAAASVGESEGETGKKPVAEIGERRSLSAIARAAFLDQVRALFEEQTRRLRRDSGAIDDFAEQPRERLEFRLGQLGKRLNQAILRRFGGALE
jgi:hypothetical protein